MNKRLVFLAAAIALLALAAWLMPSVNPSEKVADGGSTESSAPPVFPLGPTPADQAKLQARKTLPPSAAAGSPTPSAATPTSPSARRDALLVALPPDASDVIVMEAQSFLQRPLVKRIGDCLAAQGTSIPFQALGLSVADLDRVALADFGDAGSMAVLSGNVEKLDVTRLLKNSVEARYGDYGRVFESQLPGAQQGTGWAVARWRDALVLMGKPRAQVEQAIDRLEGRAPSQPLFADSSVYGDAYGRISAMTMRRALPLDMAAKAAAANLGVELHIDAKKDLLVVAEAHGEPEASQTIGKAVAAALATQRAASASSGDKATVRLLDVFRVKLEPDGFRMQAGFTEALLRKQFGSCFDDSLRGAAGSGSTP